jgi:hypothetical protein
MKERLQRWAKFLGSISVITGALIVSWKVVHHFDVRLALVEESYQQVLKSRGELVHQFDSDLSGLRSLVEVWQEDTDKLGKVVERFDLELRDARLAAARAGLDAEAFSELQITHVYTELDSIEDELDRMNLMQDALFRAVTRLDSSSLEGLIGKDTLYISAPEDTVPQRGGHWWNPFD